MPYVPSMKTDGKSTDRIVIDAALAPLVKGVAAEITNNFSLRKIYRRVFVETACHLRKMLMRKKLNRNKDDTELMWDLAQGILMTGAKYGYEGAYLGEFNYAFTRFIQLVPQEKVKRGDWQEKDELRYWLYAETVTALRQAANCTENLDIGVDGVFLDIKDEYKRRVNVAYEAAQILKSGDCYDTPYYTRLVEVVSTFGTPIGHLEIMLKRQKTLLEPYETVLHPDLLNYEIVLRDKR